jgi:hypothetical protein
MDIKEAYKIHSIVEEINKTNKDIERIGRTLTDADKFNAGEIHIVWNEYKTIIPVSKDRIEPLLQCYLQCLKENIERKLHELMYIEVKSEIKPEKLNELYMELNRIHLDYKPQWRFGQFIHNFNMWLESQKLKDIFYIEEDEMIKLLKEYVGENKWMNPKLD